MRLVWLARRGMWGDDIDYKELVGVPQPGRSVTGGGASGILIVWGEQRKFIRFHLDIPFPGQRGRNRAISSSRSSPTVLPRRLCRRSLSHPSSNSRRLAFSMASCFVLALTVQYQMSAHLPLRNYPHVAERADLAWRVEHLLAHTEHTRGRLVQAIHHMKKVVRLKRSLSSPSGQSWLSPDLLWLGYEYLCLAKRPNPFRIRSILALPFRVLRGQILISQSVRRVSRDDKARLSALAAYYPVDLIHSWASILLVLAPRASYLIG